jgi:ATP-binding cassette subfamily C protein
VLDEPNSNLDRDGDEALTKAILGVRARGGIVVVVCHRPSALAGVDQVLVMQAGASRPSDPRSRSSSRRSRRRHRQAPAARPLTPMRVHAGGRSQEYAS